MATTALAKSDTTNTLATMLERSSDAIRRALPAHLRPERMTRILLTALRSTPELGRCTPVSFLACALQLAALGLEPNTPLGLAYLIPRKGDCTMLLGYQGMLALARRTREIRSIRAHVVYEGDHFAWEEGLRPNLVHRPAQDAGRTGRQVTHAYAVALLADSDEPLFVVLSRDEIESRRKRGASGAGHRTPWDTDYAAMAQKSAIRALWRWLPKSAEVADAIAADEAEERGQRQLTAFGPDVRDAVERAGLGLALPEAPEELDAQEQAPAQVLCPAGQHKGKPLSEVPSDELRSIRERVSGALEDPSKRRHHESNERLLAALIAELDRRADPEPAPVAEGAWEDGRE